MHRWTTLLLLCPLLLVQLLFVQQRLAAETIVPTFSKQTPPFKAYPHALADPVATTLATLAQTADLIVRGRVTGVQSFWRPDHTIIESDVTITVAYPLLGNPRRTVTLRTPGGYLADERLGMISTHAAAFALGEEVLLFLQKQGATWQMVDGAAGKFLIEGKFAFNPDLAFVQPIAGLLPHLVTLVVKRGMKSPLPVAWSQLETRLVSASRQLVAASSPKPRWSTPHAAAPFYIHLNTDQIGAGGDRAHFRNAILAAAAAWSNVASADFMLSYAGETTATQTSYNGVNEVLFMHKGSKERAAAAQVWYTDEQAIVEADIWINDDYVWSVTGTPGAYEVDLQSALLHEFGHWLILGHSADTDAVMFSKLSTGTLKRQLQQPDILGISAIYPR